MSFACKEIFLHLNVIHCTCSKYYTENVHLSLFTFVLFIQDIYLFFVTYNATFSFLSSIETRLDIYIFKSRNTGACFTFKNESESIDLINIIYFSFLNVLLAYRKYLRSMFLNYFRNEHVQF